MGARSMCGGGPEEEEDADVDVAATGPLVLELMEWEDPPSKDLDRGLPASGFADAAPFVFFLSTLLCGIGRPKGGYLALWG
jgi:hypothetical protein